MSSIELQSICKSYGHDAQVLRDVNLQVSDGEFCVFIGPSGCGKSTLLRMIAGLEGISSGDLTIGGVRMNDMPPAQRRVAMVFQSYALFPHLTVFENMAFGMQLAKMPEQLIHQKVNEAARVLKLSTLLDRKPKALSGGQRQRVAIGRAIVREPNVFLFDEPLSNLDAALRAQTRLEIANIHRSFGKASAIYVTHDQVEAMTLADKILLLNTGATAVDKGSVAQMGSPLDLYHRPCNLFVAGFIGSPKMNFLRGSYLAGSSDTAIIQLNTGEIINVRVNAGRLHAGQAVTVGVRPEHTVLGTSTQHIIRSVRWQERLGDTTYFYLDGSSEQEQLIARAPGAATAVKGQQIALALPADNLHLFDDRGHALDRCTLIEDHPIGSIH